MIVRFNSVEEFCDELRKEQGNIERRIVRITNLFKPSKLSANIKIIHVLATFLVVNPLTSLPYAGPHIVRLERYCGDIWDPHGTDPSALKEAEKVSKKIEEVCKELNLEVRAGVIETDTEKQL